MRFTPPTGIGSKRIRNRDMVRPSSSDEPWYGCKTLYSKANRHARGLGAFDHVRSNPVACHLVLVKRASKGRHRTTIDAVTGRGALTAALLEQALLPKLERHALLVSDSHAAYRVFSRKHGIAHEAVNLRAGERLRPGVGIGTEGAIHVQNVNSYHQRFKAWLLGFRGVASCYLPNYLGWRWALDGGRINSPEQ